METNVAPVPVQASQEVVVSPDAWKSSVQMQHLWKVATSFASSALIPEQFRNKPTEVAIVLQMAARSGLDPIQLLQNVHIVKGKPGLAAPFAIAQANASGVFKGRIKFRTEGQGDKLAVTAYATLAETGEEVARTVSLETARKEGWTSNSKYASIPEQMLSYRAAMFLIRLHAPEALLGMPIREEIEIDNDQSVETLNSKLRKE